MHYAIHRKAKQEVTVSAMIKSPVYLLPLTAASFHPVAHKSHQPTALQHKKSLQLCVDQQFLSPSSSSRVVMTCDQL